MNNNLTPLHLLLKSDSFRFDPKLCRNANVSLMEAKLLRWLFFDEHSNEEIIQNFGLGIAFKLLKQGYIANPLGEQGTAHTNLWKLTDAGLEILYKITGKKL